jgi:hypothetical protein
MKFFILIACGAQRKLLKKFFRAAFLERVHFNGPRYERYAPQKLIPEVSSAAPAAAARGLSN